MRCLFVLSSLAIATIGILASELEVKSAYLPLYVSNGVVNEGEEGIHDKPRKVAFISRGAEPETTLSLLSAPFVPKHDSTWAGASDANLISTCGITLTHRFRDTEDGPRLEVTLNCSDFSRPEGLRLGELEVVALAKKAVELNFPSATVLVSEMKANPRADDKK